MGPLDRMFAPQASSSSTPSSSTSAMDAAGYDRFSAGATSATDSGKAITAYQR
jgi:hypothetical protein